MTCPDDNALSEFIAGALGPAELAAVEDHIDGCDACRGLLVALAPDLDLANREPEEPRSPRAQPIEWDAVLQSRYVPERILGAGGMSIVYEGRDRRLDRPVALKVMLNAPEDVRARLRREARALAMLSHPNVVDVYDADLSQGNTLLACELVDGGSLRVWLTETVRTTAEIIGVILDAARGLEAAHAMELVHRDVTPNNILVGSDGRGRVADFGLARLPVLAETSPDEPLSDGSNPPTLEARRRTGAVGTPGYIAPEVRLGLDAGPAADQYSLCVTAYEALHGMLPGTARRSEAVRSVPRVVDRILARGMSEAPSDRFASMAAFRRALHDAARPRWRTRLALAAAALAGVSAVGIGMQGATPACAGTSVGVPSALVVDTHAMAPRVAADVSAYAAQWQGVRRRTCDAAERELFTARALDRRWACLKDRHADLQVTVEALADTVPGPSTVTAQLYQLEQLHPPSNCEDDARLERHAPLPPASLVADVDRLEQRIRRARARMWIDSEGAKTVAEVVAEAAELGYDPLTARALLMRGTLEREQGNFDAALETLQTAAHMATAAKADVTAAYAALIVISIQGYDNQDFDTAMEFRPMADAAVARLGAPPDLAASLHGVLALVYDRHSNFVEAEHHHREAVRLTAVARGRETFAYAEAMANFGAHHNLREHPDAAREAVEEALEIIRARLGEGTLNEAMLLRNLAATASGQGEPERALGLAEQALAITTELLDDDDPRQGPFLTSVGQANVGAGRFEIGIGQLAHALKLDEGYLPANHPMVIDARRLLADAYVQAERPEEADAVLSRAMEELEALHPPAQATLLGERGILLLSMARFEEAESLCERARVVATAIPDPRLIEDVTRCRDDARRQGRADALPRQGAVPDGEPERVAVRD